MDGRSEACDVWDVGTAGDVRPASTDAMRAQRWIEEVWEGKEKRLRRRWIFCWAERPMANHDSGVSQGLESL